LRPWSSEIGCSLMPSRLNCLKQRARSTSAMA
jgi:hypothetical protein